MNERFDYSFEGLDGAGKTTHTTRLKNHLEQLGHSVALITSPSRSLVGKIIRANIFTMETSTRNKFYQYDIKRASRSIPPTIDVVLWDRHLDSIYSSNSETSIQDLAGFHEGIKKPNKVFLLDISPEIAWQREGEITDHPLDMAWLRMKYDRYTELVKRYPDKFIVVNAARHVDDVYDCLIKSIIDDMTKTINQ
jgi:thymidylate kinase